MTCDLDSFYPKFHYNECREECPEGWEAGDDGICFESSECPEGCANGCSKIDGVMTCSPAIELKKCACDSSCHTCELGSNSPDRCLSCNEPFFL